MITSIEYHLLTVRSAYKIWASKLGLNLSWISSRLLDILYALSSGKIMLLKFGDCAMWTVHKLCSLSWMFRILNPPPKPSLPLLAQLTFIGYIGYGHPIHYNTCDYSVSKKNSGHCCILYFFIRYKNCTFKIDVRANVRTFSNTACIQF